MNQLQLHAAIGSSPFIANRGMHKLCTHIDAPNRQSKKQNKIIIHFHIQIICNGQSYEKTREKQNAF